ncbi:D-beta-hydroxybutyrate dehydrogenase, mitochondrial-like [Macrosteles quadrilineatus]|uniref:D-beta-hydroxybutyrate dehydrogenase, mitochondrial-like n=1 Tax=Macrosteles quadrilineatus TaxID=74068 RepID=UPI0023E22604|nr:D-beta-hydroxybutyrate dehydrogenase, mitochondrial-like [Macrosteles quadrilineatus]
MIQPRLIACAAAVLAVSTGVWLRRKRRLSADRLVVAITGCDSGIGYSTALHCHCRGFTVVAAVLDLNSSGAQDLLRIAQISGRLEVVMVDVRHSQDISRLVDRVSSLLDNNNNLKFHSIINNAGVMVFGEMEWQTEQIVDLQLEVNLLGAITVARLFAPLLRKYKGRVINMTSHCGSLPLPGLSVYAASKAGLQAWSDALRVEWAKYNISVISLIPGAFFQQTNILSNQNAHAETMLKAMSEEAKKFYGSYYQLYQSYLTALSGDKPAAPVQSVALYRLLDSALLDPRPRPHYHNTPWRYSLYHNLACVAPIVLRDALVTRFVAMPQYKPDK